ncbi:MAG: hypothetical protein QW279_09980 [Candidatus Jordarchaeaceae archaeon]
MERHRLDGSFDVAQFLVNLAETGFVRVDKGIMQVGRRDANRGAYYIIKSETLDRGFFLGRIQSSDLIDEVVYENGMMYLVCGKVRRHLTREEPRDERELQRIVLDKKVFEPLRDYVFLAQGEVLFTEKGIILRYFDKNRKTLKEYFVSEKLPLKNPISASIDALKFIIKMPGEHVLLRELENTIDILVERNGYYEKKSYRTEYPFAHGWGLFIFNSATYYTPFRVIIGENGISIHIISKYGTRIYGFDKLLEYEIHDIDRAVSNVVEEYKHNREFIKLLHQHDHEIVDKIRRKFLEYKVSKIETSI